jgi:hypothetical protein
MLRVWALATPHMIYVYIILYHFLGSWLPLLEMLLLAATVYLLSFVTQDGIPSSKYGFLATLNYVS